MVKCPKCAAQFSFRDLKEIAFEIGKGTKEAAKLIRRNGCSAVSQQCYPGSKLGPRRMVELYATPNREMDDG